MNTVARNNTSRSHSGKFSIMIITLFLVSTITFVVANSSLQSSTLLNRAHLQVTMIEYSDVFGVDPVCKPFLEELRKYPPLPTEYEWTSHLDPKRFVLPAWKRLNPRENIEIIREIVLGHYHVRRDSLDAAKLEKVERDTVERELPILMKDYDRGRMALEEVKIDLEKDGDPEIVYRLQRPAVEDLVRLGTPWYFRFKERDVAPLAWWYYGIEGRSSSPVEIGARGANVQSHNYDSFYFDGQPYLVSRHFSLSRDGVDVVSRTRKRLTNSERVDRIAILKPRLRDAVRDMEYISLRPTCIYLITDEGAGP